MVIVWLFTVHCWIFILITTNPSTNAIKLCIALYLLRDAFGLKPS